MDKENVNQKPQKENLSEGEDNKESSQILHQKDSSINLSSDNNLNQKYFPSKENFFGVKTSPKSNKGNPLSSGSHSPILNYFSGLSPERKDYYPSPKEGLYNNQNVNNKLSPLNFNYSPSTIFNAPNNKDMNSFSLQNSGNFDDDNKTLQEKMNEFVKTDANNFIRINSNHSNSSNLQENKNEDDKDDEDDDDNEETFTLNIDSSDEDYFFGAKQYKPLHFNEKNQFKKSSIFKNMNNHNNLNDNLNNNMINNNLNDNINNVNNNINNNINNINVNEQIPQNLNIQEKPKTPKEKEKNDNNNNDEININKEEPKYKENTVENIINKKEFKPYIPNKYRNKFKDNQNDQNYMNDINYDININQNLIENNFGIGFKDDSNLNNDFTFMNNINNQNPNYFQNNKNQNYNFPESNLFNNFYYNGDNYQISNFKEYKKNDYLKTGEIPSISAADIVTAITANNKKIKRIDPNTYLNESIEYLSYNIFPLAKDQAGCRFLQEKLEQNPEKASEAFYNAIIPFVLPLVKDAFGNYLIQKLCYYLSPEKIKKFLEIISPTILDVGSNSHGTRVIQHLINFLSTKELVDYFLTHIKPYVIPLLKELNGTHIINKLVNDHPECADEINKIIIENCSLLATHRHGCCILQKLLDGPNKKLKTELINNLVENCFVLIIDQFGNYVIQTILLLNDSQASSAIAMKICDNMPYYSKHRYSSNVIEKCFDFCGKKERKLLIEKLCSPDVITDLILDEHGNYVIQKALFYADSKTKEIMLNNIILLIPKIKNVSFGEKLLTRLFTTYPQLNTYIYKSNDTSLKDAIETLNTNPKNKKNKKKVKKKKNKNKKNNNIINNPDNNNNIFMNNNSFVNNNSINNNNINVNSNITINNYNNINNNSMSLNDISNNNNINQFNFMNFNNNMTGFSPELNNNNNNNNQEQTKKKKKKKNKKKKNNNQDNNNIDKKNNNNFINSNLMMNNNNLIFNNNYNNLENSIYPNNNLNKEI